MTYDIGNPGLEQAQKCAMVKSVNGISTIPSDNWILNNMKELNKVNNKKPAQIHFQSKRSYIITKINNNINLGKTIAGSVKIF